MAALSSTRVAQTSSTAERVADALREQVVEGRLLPGVRLGEPAFCEAMRVSRNTLREAFSQLVAERILVREAHRGVFVATPGVTDVHDVYRSRRIVEPAAVRHGERARDEAAIARVRDAVDEGRSAAAAEDWAGVADANQHFHRALVSLAGSTRLDQQMDLLLAEMRLAFHRVGTHRDFHEPYLERNDAVAALVEQGELEKAALEVADYLADAEARIVASLTGAGP
ncbi:GntR family transcriptional regulator [Actinomycetospora sp. TBRC 11914]|nr:GntR family transcriptional regulator [Actinomycetospora sp. TBRC 11914]